MKSIRLFALALGLTLICTVLPWQSHASRDKSAAPDETSSTSWLRLDSPRSLELKNGSVTPEMHPRSLAAGDLDSDGVPDLVSGYGLSSGGQIVVRRGNISALFPNAQNPSGGSDANASQDAFLPNGQRSLIPKPADFVGTGDFDADGNWDVVTAARGDRVLFFLKGNGRGDLARPKQIPVNGRVTVLVTGDVNRRDGLTDIVVGVQRSDSSSLLVFENATGALQGVPETIPLPAEAVSIGTGQLDESHEIDLVVAAGHEVIFIQGRDRKISLDEERRSLVSNPQISSSTFETQLSSLAIGDFTGDARDEVAVDAVTLERPEVVDDRLVHEERATRLDRDVAVEARDLLRAEGRGRRG